MSKRRWVGLAVPVVGVLLAVAGCAGTTGSVADVQDVEWRFASSEGVTIEPGTADITATFSDGTVAGSGGVNSYSGPCTLRADGSLEVGDITSTLMAGSDEANAAEAAYFGTLREMVSWELSGQSLVLSDAGGTVSLTFER